jgi:hypothetical protein
VACVLFQLFVRGRRAPPRVVPASRCSCWRKITLRLNFSKQK